MTGVDGLDLNKIPTPYYLVDETLLTRNLEMLAGVADRTGCRILLAQKAFSMFYFYPLIGKYLHGTTSSGLFEARLGYEEMSGAEKRYLHESDKCEIHIFSPAYKDSEFDEILTLCDHISFNSFTQWEKFKTRAVASGRQCGIRINPECSTQEHGIYDPCSPGSRLGVPSGQFRGDLLEGISGLHFHTLCEQNADALVETLKAVEEKFGSYLYQMKWLNIGGGHHITRPDYNVELLVQTINRLKEKYNLQIYIEPGEAVALNAGYLVSEVIDLLHNDVDIAIVDTSAACHMPDVLEMPYRPGVVGSGMPTEKSYTYRLGGPTCLAGDIIGDYSFDEPLKPGDKLVFCDMAIYSMVKNNTFNGIGLPSIAVVTNDRKIRLVKKFGYEDFKERLS